MSLSIRSALGVVVYGIWGLTVGCSGEMPLAEELGRGSARLEGALALSGSSPTGVEPDCLKAKGAPGCLVSLALPYNVACGEGGPTVKLAVYADHKLPEASAPDSPVKRAIISIHGQSGQADNAFTAVVNSLGYRADTLVIAPYFGGDKANAARKDCSDCVVWEDGEGSFELGVLDSSYKVRSFEILEKLAQRLTEVYPGLQEITFAGFSKGAQTVQRFAAMSRGLPAGSASTARLRFVVSSPSSYLYFDKLRLKQSGAASCLDKTKTAKCDVRKDFVERVEACDGAFDDYKYGFTKVRPYLPPHWAGGAWERYRDQDVTYILNSGDACKKPHATDGDKGNAYEPDGECAAVLQGPADASYRLQRGLVYFNYLKQRDEEIGHRLYVVDGASDKCGHNNTCLYEFDIVRQALVNEQAKPSTKRPRSWVFDPETTELPKSWANSSTCEEE